MLNAQDSLVLVIDIQDKLTKMLKEEVCTQIVEKSQKLVQAAKILNIDTLLSEQYPKGLGQTIEGIRNILGENYKPFEKTSFSVLDDENIASEIEKHGKKQIVLCGIESHICVLQSALALIDKGYEVYVVQDVCASRNKYEYKCAMDYLKNSGAKVLCLEMVLFGWLKGAKNPCFKEVQALIK